MGRRIFEARKFQLHGHVIPLEYFSLCTDLKYGFEIPKFRRDMLIRKAETAMETPIPQLLASEYMLFCKTGNRSVYEEKYDFRRIMLLDLALGEHVEKQGRFTEKMVDVLWAILEETTWTIPAHNRYRPGGHANLPYAFGSNVDYIDLYSAATGAAVAVASYLHKERFDAVSPEINNRIGYELDRQLLKPYLDDGIMLNKCKWSGLSGIKVNNWCPWIATNLLTVCSLTVADMGLRTKILERSLQMLDNFSAASPADGGCDEGPRYWELAGGSLWAACAIARDLTGGYIDMSDEPLLKAMGEYELKMISAPGYLLNFADAMPHYIPNPYLLYHWGTTCQSTAMIACAGLLMNGQPLKTDYRTPYKYLRYLTTPDISTGKYNAKKKEYIESLQIAITRSCNQMDRGLYLAVKGGHNGESHNHNDLGNFVVYSDGVPVFIDVGVGEYTKRYFSPDRYDVWHTCSDYHNCATFNGVTQKNGMEFAARDVTYEPESGAVSMSLEDAYPTEAGLEHYRRTAVLENGMITLTDHVKFHELGTVMFSLITTQVPENVTEDSFMLQGRRVSFDPDLSYKLETLDFSVPEAEPIPRFWNVDMLYRVTLTGKEKIKEKDYILKVK